MNLCEWCQNARAFIREEKVKKAAKKVASAAVVTCVVCGVAIGLPASPASGRAQTAVRTDYSAYVEMWPNTSVTDYPVQFAASQVGGNSGHPMFQPLDHGDSEPPHMDGPELTMDGTAWTYAGTATTFGVASGSPHLGAWPQSAAGAATTVVLPTGRVQQNAIPGTAGPLATFSMLALPEHAALQSGPPVMEPVLIRKAYNASAVPRSGRNRDRHAT